MPNTFAVVLAYDRLCTFEFGCAVEVFGLPRPEFGADWYRFAIAGIEPGPLRAMGGLSLNVDGGLDLLEQAGTIIIPGWRGVDEPVPPALCDALVAAHQRGARLLSLCSGAFVLAATGLLDGKRATTHWRYAGALQAKHPTIRFMPDVLYVDEGSLLTAAGSAAGLDLCLHLVRRDWGPAKANQVARRLVLPAHRQGGQAQYVEAPMPAERHSGSRIAPLLDAVLARLDEDWPISRLAAEAALSLRSLHRHFIETTGQSPGAWLLAARLIRARDLLETTPLPIEEVAAASGFGTAANLRHHVSLSLGTSPSAYRARFSALAR
ncbi:transcriptional regulator FtrA [Acidisoma cellulosilytica]|uniref:Transcriptional regulator FtrA n=1 Tax=Acidisoma cellulosilyticum TaxID=2802395 RepID=A0A963Z7J8_9PROT|nr:transcriptional regulator FtrA [Acidisoma cellulosilyticum]MCB8883317.1 transcriptional regulator FtrA [Acidisoma cellulosilyticum]